MSMHCARKPSDRLSPTCRTGRVQTGALVGPLLGSRWCLQVCSPNRGTSEWPRVCMRPVTRSLPMYLEPALPERPSGKAGGARPSSGTLLHRVSVHVRVAGYYAELRYCELVGGCPADRHPTLSVHDDNERAWASAQETCSGDLPAASRLLAEARATVEERVSEEWSRIERVAIALYESPDGFLRAGRIAELLVEPPSPWKSDPGSCDD